MFCAQGPTHLLLYGQVYQLVIAILDAWKKITWLSKERLNNKRKWKFSFRYRSTMASSCNHRKTWYKKKEKSPPQAYNKPWLFSVMLQNLLLSCCTRKSSIWNFRLNIENNVRYFELQTEIAQTVFNSDNCTHICVLLQVFHRFLSF